MLARGGHRKLKGATVFVDGEPVAETDGEGTFSVRLALGHHRLQAVASGYAAADVPVDVPAAGVMTYTLRLSPGGPVHETVVATKPQIAAVRVDAEEARTTAGTGGDPFRVIESLPGVSQIVWPFALYAIRGANPGNTGFFLDGMRVPALFHFALGPSIVHPYLIDKLSFYPGGYPARLGGYVSGAVSAETAAPPHDIARFTADVRLYDAGGLATTPWDGGRGTVAVAARYAYTGLIVSRLFGNVDFGYADYQLRVDHTLAGRARDAAGARIVRSARHQGREHRRRVAELPPRRPALGTARRRLAVAGADRVRHRRGAVAALRQPDPRARVQRRAARRDVARAARRLARDRRRRRGAALRDRHDVRDVGDAGADARCCSPIWRGRATRCRCAATSPRSCPYRRLTLEPGLRYAQYFEQGVTRGAFEPRLTVRFAVVPALAIDATVGRFSQMPSLPVGVAGFEAFGLRDFGLQTSTQAALGVEARLPAELTLRVTGFHQWLLVSDMRSTFSTDVTTPGLPADAGGPRLRRRGDAAPARQGARARLAGVHAVVEHARVRRRVRAVGLGPAPHPEPGQRGPAGAAAIRSAAASTTTPAAPIRSTANTCGCPRSGRSICARTNGWCSTAAPGTSTSSSGTRRSTNR